MVVMSIIGEVKHNSTWKEQARGLTFNVMADGHKEQLDGSRNINEGRHRKGDGGTNIIKNGRHKPL